MSDRSYDKHATNYGTVRVPHDDIKELLAGIGLPSPAAAVLDIGCGSLRETASLVPLVAEFVGIDRSLAMLRAGAQERALLVVADMDQALPFKDRHFTHCLMISSIHHASNVRRLVRDVSRVCRDAARLLIVTHSPKQVLQRPTYKFFPGLASISSRRFPDPDIVAQALGEEGFSTQINLLHRPAVAINSDFFERVKERAFDSAFFLIGSEEWEVGLRHLAGAIHSGEQMLYPRDRVIIRAMRSCDC